MTTVRSNQKEIYVCSTCGSGFVTKAEIHGIIPRAVDCMQRHCQGYATRVELPNATQLKDCTPKYHWRHITMEELLVFQDRDSAINHCDQGGLFLSLPTGELVVK